MKTGVFSLVCNYLRPSNNSRQLIFKINSCFGTNKDLGQFPTQSAQILTACG